MLANIGSVDEFFLYFILLLCKKVKELRKTEKINVVGASWVLS